MRPILLLLCALFAGIASAKDMQTVHVLVALCDNKYQGIQPVPAKIGNGQDPDSNLYWGCSEGVRSYFKKSTQWQEIRCERTPDGVRLERVVFQHKTKPWYLVADAYDGRRIIDCMRDFLNACAGREKGFLSFSEHRVALHGNTRLVVYIGHNGLMDNELSNNFDNADGQKRDAIILACASRPWFTPYLKKTEANPILWTSGLMYPGAFILHDALDIYIKGGTAEELQTAAATAYVKNQRCSLKAAKNLLPVGW